MDILFGVIIGIIVLTILVVVHELGHAIVARRNGVVVEEFGVGFPPRAWSKTVKKSFLGDNVTYSINALPLGGFVKLQGENDSAKGKGDYGAATFWQKTKILLAGVFMNWVAAAVLLAILSVSGIPRLIPNQFTIPSDTTAFLQPVELRSIVDGSPAQAAGLEVGDKIVRFDGSPVPTADDLFSKISDKKGQKVEVIYSRASVESKTSVTLRSDNADKKGYLGAGLAQQEFLKATWSAPLVGIGTTAQFTWITLEELGNMVGKLFSGLVMQLSPDQSARETAQKELKTVGDSVAGPVGIFGVIFPNASKAGPSYVLLLGAIISLTLAVMNILPIPALDGGRWFLSALFRLMKKPLTKDLEERINGIGFMVLMGLIILVTIADIGKFR